jgi:hypothetical protein
VIENSFGVDFCTGWFWTTPVQPATVKIRGRRQESWRSENKRIGGELAAEAETQPCRFTLRHKSAPRRDRAKRHESELPAQCVRMNLIRLGANGDRRENFDLLAENATSA